MISETAVDAIEACKKILIEEIYEDLKHTEGGRTNVNVKFLDQFDGDPCICEITSVYIKDDIVFVDYVTSYGNKYSDDIELFTVDTIAEILSEL